VQVLNGMDWPPPDGGALSPAGEYNLYLGITKEFTPDMIATASEPASVFEGHAFIIEAAV
jgi:DNA topoisomerase-6 subunit B